MSRSRLALIVLAALTLGVAPDRPRMEIGEAKEAGAYPSDWFGLQRAFPFGTIPQAKYEAAFQQARMERAIDQRAALNQIDAITWSQAGPYNIGGRVTALAAKPANGTIYLGAANGGVFKSFNFGSNWTPIFDVFGVYSIGALALGPNGTDTLWVGTGEANSAVDTYDGAGLFRTTNGGTTWEYRGLKETARIARVAVDPQNTSRVFVAAMGAQFSTGDDRGLYRTEDAGETWTKVLFVNDSTGVCDVVVNPAHPETLFAATWERVRRPSYRRAYGPGCGIWRSVDHGTTWTRLQTGLPVPSDDVGRIGLAIAPSRPSTVYAQITSGVNLGYRGLGLYRSLDGGGTWTKRDQVGFAGSFGGFSWYFGDMAVDPNNPDRMFCLGMNVIRSTDGGVSFTSVTGSAHVDEHAIYIDPANSNRVYLGNDGGFFSSSDFGNSWTKSTDLPISQFYAGAIDPANPNRLMGGTQDNNTLLTGGSPTGWVAVLGGDGFQCLFDFTNSSIMFAEYQNASGGQGPLRSTNGGSGFSAPGGIDGGDRFNWNTPFVMDPTNHNVMLVGSQRVYKSTDNGQNYTPVSDDLTTQPEATLVYGTITTLAISPVSPSTYYAGTDDGKVWRSVDAGGSWQDISAGLPQRWVTRLTADAFVAGGVYVTLSGFGMDEHLAHVYRSTDRGDTWTSISSNLPDVPANDIVTDPADPQTLYLATDVGVYATHNLGAGWFQLGFGLPTQAIFDLSFHPASRTLVAATHGRSQWKLVVDSPPTAVGPRTPAPSLALSAPTPNPMRTNARFELALSRRAPVDVSIHDVTGRRVRRLASGVFDPGTRALRWDGRDESGHDAGSGVFFVRANAEGAFATRRIVRVE